MSPKDKASNKIYFIVLDGAADRPILSLNYKTPLEIAKTPNLDKLALNGTMSLIRILPEHLVPETDSGLMALLGYDPLTYYSGRGSLEALGCELIKSYKYFVGFRINFASYDEQKEIIERRTARNIKKAELQQLAAEIRKNINLSKYNDISFELIAFGVHRGILVFYSNTTPLSGNVSNTDPGFIKEGYFSKPLRSIKYQKKSCYPLDDSKAAWVTSNIVNDFIEQSSSILRKSIINTNRILKGELPCNLLIFRDGGDVPKKFPSFRRKYNKSLMIFGELPCEKALANLIHADYFYTQEFELQLDEAYLHKTAQQLIFCDKDVVFCHLKGPDEPGHDNKPLDKIKSIEMIDNCFFQELVEHSGENDILIVTCDHATPCELGVHSNDLVPLLVSGYCISSDSSQHFDEVNGYRGLCPVKRAVDIMDYITSLGDDYDKSNECKITQNT